MRVTLVFPGSTDAGFRSYGEEPNSSWHSHGLCSISSCLKQAHHQVDLIDLRTLTGWEEYCQKIRDLAPDAICITMMSCSFNPALRCAELAHRTHPSVKVIAGGPHPSVLPEEVAAYPEFDYIVQGEGEISLIEMLSSFDAGRPVPRITVGTPPDLDALPFADRELFGPHEIPHPIEGFLPPLMTFIAGRGCRYNCAFCQPAERKIFGRSVRRRSPENFVRELVECRERYNFNSYAIHDDCLLEDIAWVERFCSLLEEHDIRIPFSCQGRADLICRNPGTLKNMKKVGLSLICVGFESGSDRVLRFLRKGVRVAQNIEAAGILKELGIKIWANYMLGIPTETREEMEETVRMIKRIAPEHFSPSIYTPHPGSDMYEYCRENGLMLSLSHDSFRHNITEVKIKGQDWHAIEWAVAESLIPGSGITPYSGDYVSTWGELVNLAGNADWQETASTCRDGMDLPAPAVQNLVRAHGTGWRSTTIDPQFIWDFSPPLDPADWRYIVVDLESSHTGKASFYWWTGEYAKFQATKKFRVLYGRNTYAFDLHALKTYKNLVGDDIRWGDAPVRRLRFDPCEREGVGIVLHGVRLLGDR
jgi:anaerobic magnesium-protoporphyrin IX monomethyl ester cyclase